MVVLLPVSSWSMGVSAQRVGLPIALALYGSLGCGLQTAGMWSEDESDGVETFIDGDGGWPTDGDARPDDAVAREDAGEILERPDDAASDSDGAADDACTADAPELCNGLDDDCDGTADEGLECALGDEFTCGPCELGHRSCTATCTWTDCTTDPEVCSPGGSETCTPPRCVYGHRRCLDTCAWDACIPDHGDCTPGETRSCTADRCGTGTDSCGESCTWGGCVWPCSRSELTCCPGVGCLDLNWNDDHCGDCDTDCGLFSICWDGGCT